MANPDLEPGALAKPAKGSYTLKRDKARNDDDAKLEKAAKAAKARDHNRCRWPERHKCRGGLEAAHLKDKSRGGDNSTENLFTICAWLHRLGPETIHSKDLVIDPLTNRGADGICNFLRRDWGNTAKPWELVGRERAIGLLERRRPERTA